jgi:hypothetical protein
MSRGKPIDEFADPVELLHAMRNAVRSHRSLLIDSRILHRDISVNNIMTTIPSECPRADGFHGFLIDLSPRPRHRCRFCRPPQYHPRALWDARIHEY